MIVGAHSAGLRAAIARRRASRGGPHPRSGELFVGGALANALLVDAEELGTSTRDRDYPTYDAKDDREYCDGKDRKL